MFKKKQSDNNGRTTDGLNTVLSGKSIENTQWAKWGNKNSGHGFAAEDANAQAD